MSESARAYTQTKKKKAHMHWVANAKVANRILSLTLSDLT